MSPTRAPGDGAFVAGPELVEQLDIADLDAALFDAPYIAINEHNRGVGTADAPAAAWALVRQHGAASLAGTARPGVQVIDIDPADTEASPEAGTAAAENIRDWCAGFGLPYLLRASGRPGGHHVIAVVPDDLVAMLVGHVAAVAEHQGVSVELRNTLRLLAAPHRHGLPSPLLEGTLVPADVPRAPNKPKRRSAAPRRARAARPRGATPSRSEREYGRTCAAIRRGLTFGQTWDLLNGSQVIERGQVDYRKYMWFPAVTEIAAERGLDEDAAWTLAQRASTARAHALGRRAWRQRYWLPAIARAADPARARRRRLTDEPAQPEQPEQHTAAPQQQAAEHERVRAAMHAAATDLLNAFRPQRQKSIRAVIDALAVVLTSSAAGSIDVRTLAEQACVSKGVTIQVKASLEEHGVIAVSERYAGGADDCHTYTLGTRTDQALSETETTRWYTPTPGPPPSAPRTYGLADPTRMRLRHARERNRWKLRCTLVQATQSTGERWATSQHPAAKAARSLWAQRTRWSTLPPEVQAERRRRRRAYLGTLGKAERQAWFDWLRRRDDLAQAAERARRGPVDAHDRGLLEAAPPTVHLGMRDRNWFGGRPRGAPVDGQLPLLDRRAA
ncbi:hypothetical protein [Actinokineospora enzanensis]|uniref:hypothetical protein n=1 Tax=Actinokineospora enzanensis TaxID=155975 RepID=UPI0003A1AB26|nr:hypothetical protein [Actinokineospora enzanensis]